jgi:hypothetical protein
MRAKELVSVIAQCMAILAAVALAASASAETDYLADFNEYPGGICEFWKVFDVEECLAQRRIAEKGVKDMMRLEAIGSQHCQRWQEELPHALAQCESEKNESLAYALYVRDATHVLVDQNRLVCQSEKSFRETMNAILIDKDPHPRHLRSKVCKIIDREALAYLDRLSEDGRVAEIRYTVWSGAVPTTAYTDPRWLVTRERYKQIVEERKSARY